MIGADAALLGLIGVIVGSLLSQRGARRVAGEDRLWARRADLYLELLDWLDRDQALFKEGEPRQPRPRELQAGIQAFGTEQMERQIVGYDRVRADAAAGHPHGQQQVFLRSNWIRLAIRHELAALPARGERLGLSLASNRFVFGPAARLRTRLDDRQLRRQTHVEDGADSA